MKLSSVATLKALIAQRGLSLGDLAEMSGVSKGFISHLTASRKSSCKPATAERIALALGVPRELLFEAVMPTSASQDTNQNRRAA